MPIASCIPALALFTACSVVPPQAWTFDPTQPPPRASLPMAEVVALNERTAQLQLRRNEIRARIANERDAGQRLALYDQLHRVGVELSPLDRRLAGVAAAR